MGIAAFVISFLCPLALAPRLLFYYDVTPKTVVVLLGAAFALLFASAFEWDSLKSFWGTWLGRWFTVATLAVCALTAFAAVLSSNPDLAWNGSNWRRFGATTQIATMMAALAIAAWSRGNIRRIAFVLRAFCAAGVLAAIYGIGQYFGWDPILPSRAYYAGEGLFRIVRPPGPLGHSDYFAAFLLWPVFSGSALARLEESSAGRWLGRAASVTGAVAIVLSGSRGALIGMLTGALMYAVLVRPSVRRIAATLSIAGIAGFVFYVSPAGHGLRSRARWIGDEEPAGGARLLLWRDSLRMAEARPLTGFGPDTFVASFPRYQSVELARAYPDFFHESPHNVWLDTLTEEGVLGLSGLMAIVALAVWGALHAGAWRRTRGRTLDFPGRVNGDRFTRDGNPGSFSSRKFLSAALLAGLAAALAAHEFVAFMTPNALYFYLSSGLLVALGTKAGETRSLSMPTSRGLAVWPWYLAVVVSAVSAVLLCTVAVRLTSADLALGTSLRRLDAGDTAGAVRSYRRAVDRRGSGLSADLYFSRRWTLVAANARNAFSRLYFSQMAAASATLAAHTPEESQNGWYNAAALAASRNDRGAVENGLRAAIQVAPRWFKPHWALARLLASENRWAEARHEARVAVELDGGKNAEVASSASVILRSVKAEP